MQAKLLCALVPWLLSSLLNGKLTVGKSSTNFRCGIWIWGLERPLCSSVAPSWFCWLEKSRVFGLPEVAVCPMGCSDPAPLGAGIIMVLYIPGHGNSHILNSRGLS